MNTARLTVTPLAPADADDLATMLMKDALYDVIGGAPESRVAALERIGRWTAGSPTSDAQWINHIARAQDTDAVVGLCQATMTLDAAGTATECSIAYLVDPDHHGCGIGPEMMTAFLDRLVVELAPPLITAHIAPDHIPSERLAAALGLAVTVESDEDGERIWSRRTR